MPDETTNFQNLFSQYGSGADYATALDYSLKVDENLPLIPGTKNTDPNAGTWQYLSRLYTIGYGYDFSTKNGAQIEADFQSARIALPTSVLDALADYTIALRSATPAQIAESQEELDDVSDEMNAWSPNLTDAQATALMQPPIAVAQKSVIGEIANYITSNNITITYSDILAQNANNSLNALLVNEDYNGGDLFGDIQMADIAPDNLDGFLANYLFYNNKANQVYSQGIENRRVHDLVNLLSLPLATETSKPDIVTAINYGTNAVAAAYIFSSLISQNSSITSHIQTLGSVAIPNLTQLLQNSIATAEVSLKSDALYGVNKDDTWASIAAKYNMDANPSYSHA